MSSWIGDDYARVSDLQRTMAEQALAGLRFADGDAVLDIGCGDGFLTHAIARRVAAGSIVGVDPSQAMLATANGVPVGDCGPWFVVADARRLPFGRHFDVVVSFNAMHWVPEQRRALTEIAAVVDEQGRVLIQVVCAGPRTSLETVAMELTHRPRWAPAFAGFTAPFVHVDPSQYGELAASAGLRVTALTVTEHDWDFGSREEFAQWCAVGITAWTDRLAVADRPSFVDELVGAYQFVSGRPGLFMFTQMRAELTPEPS